MSKHRTRKLSDSEWVVMNALWQGAPASAREVLERVEPETGWAYSTVKTLLGRLVDKGVLVERKRANTSLYTPETSRDQARRSALRSLVDRAFEGTFGSLVHHMLKEERLSPRDRRRLQRLLDDETGEEKA